MKIILSLFLLALVSCTHGNRTGQVDFVPYKLFSENAPFKIDPAKPPEGMHMVQILLHHQGMLVEGTGCAGDYTHGHTLQNHLSMLLGLPVDSGDAMAFKLVGGCKTEWLKNPATRLRLHQFFGSSIFAI